MNKLIRGGMVVSPSGVKKLDILIKNSKIIEIGKKLKDKDAKVIDATGKFVFPGFIDAHTHFDLEVSDTVTADDFSSGSEAALCGGTTTFIDFATQNKGESLSQALNNWYIKSFSKTNCDYGFHMAISDWNDSVKDELPAMIEQGVTSFKLYMTYELMMLSDEEIFDVLGTLKKLGGIVGVHCENHSLIKCLVKSEKDKGNLDVKTHPKTRPNLCESEAVDRLLSIAGIVDVPVVIVHLSTKESLDCVRVARKRGQKVFVETCPQYLLMDDSKYDSDDFEGAKFVCAPPLRKKSDSKALWEALRNGEIDTIATDHCSFTLKQKEAGKEDFTKIPCGMPSVETRGVLMYTFGVHKKRITIERMCELLCEKPAKLYGLYPKKGSIRVGSDADIVIYNPKKSTIISSKNHHSKADYSPYENVKTKGSIDRVFLRGKEVVRDNTLIKKNKGKYIKRKKSML